MPDTRKGRQDRKTKNKSHIPYLLKAQQYSALHLPGHATMCLMPYANNKGADQPAHPRSLISAFVVRSLDNDNIIHVSLISRSEISRF